MRFASGSYPSKEASASTGHGAPPKLIESDRSPAEIVFRSLRRRNSAAVSASAEERMLVIMVVTLLAPMGFVTRDPAAPRTTGRP